MNDVRSAQRVLSILLLLASKAAPVPAATIMRACGLPRSSTYRLLEVMASRGFVTYCSEKRGWGLGSATFEMATSYLRSQPLERLARPVLRDLADTSGEVAHLGVLHGQDVLYLLKMDPPGRTARLVTQVGVRLPAHRTAVGRAILMHLPPAQLRALYPPERRVPEGQTVPVASQLERRLQAERVRGYAVDDGEISVGISCVGSALLDHRSYPVAAINVTFVSAQRQDASRRELAEQVTGAAEQISRAWRLQIENRSTVAFGNSSELSSDQDSSSFAGLSR